MEVEEQSNTVETPQPVEEARKVAYTIQDSNFPDFEVCESANAWWMNQSKVEELIRTFKLGTTIKQAIGFVGITKKQWEYFNQIHPEFRYVRENCQNVTAMHAMMTISEAITGGNIKVSMWYLERMDGRFSKESKDTDDDEEWKLPEPLDDQPKMTDEQFKTFMDKFFEDTQRKIALQKAG